jgi:hypothetical protein
MLKSSENFQKCGFASPIWTNNANAVALVQSKLHILEYGDKPECLRDTLATDQGRCHQD